jgi:hypothetical protein
MFGMPLKEAIIKGLSQDVFSITTADYRVDHGSTPVLDVSMVANDVPSQAEEVSGTGYSRSSKEDARKLWEIDPGGKPALSPGSICPICAGLGCEPCYGEGVVPDGNYDPYPSEKNPDWLNLPTDGWLKEERNPKPVGWEGVPTGGGRGETTIAVEDEPSSYYGDKMVQMTHRLSDGRRIQIRQKVNQAMLTDAHGFVNTLISHMADQIGREYAREVVGPQIRQTTQQIVDELAK